MATDASDARPATAIELLQSLHRQVGALQEQIDELQGQIARLSARRLSVADAAAHLSLSTATVIRRAKSLGLWQGKGTRFGTDELDQLACRRV